MRTVAVLLALLASPVAAQPQTRTPGATSVRGGSVINVEVDYMVEIGAGAHSHEPSRAEMDAVERMFACQGVTLNIVIDDPIQHHDLLRRAPISGSIFGYMDGPDTYGGIALEHFDRGSGWHYSVFAHEYADDDGNPSGSSGLGETPGNAFIVTLGGFAGETGTAWDRAATFAHELGHNLGLEHPGEPDGGEFVPNHTSVMSYFFQLLGVRTGLQCNGLIGPDAGETTFKELDYSHGRACSLNEFALSESRGMGIVPVDWNCDGAIAGTVVQNVNGQRRGETGWCGSSGGLGGLSDFDEWGSLEDVTALAEDAYVSREVSCVTAAEFEAYRARLTEAGRGGCAQPTPTIEACPSRQMLYLGSGGAFPAGTCRLPFRTLAEVDAIAGDGDILYVQPGSYPDAGVLTTPIQVLGPGGAVFGD